MSKPRPPSLPQFALAMLLACGGGDRDDSPDGPGDGGHSDTGGAGDGEDAGGDGTGDGVKLDVAPGADVPGDTVPPSCKVEDGDLSAPGDCTEQAPPGSFEPDVQWAWDDGEGGEMNVTATPMVANLTDDNGDGEIDLCDVPDVVVVAWRSPWVPGHMYVLDGATGTLHFRIADAVSWSVAPAIGDIDDDGVPEIVATVNDELLAFEHDGALKWRKRTRTHGNLTHAVALADVDNDGDVEIAVDGYLADHEGNVLFAGSSFNGPASATAIADLDGDDDQEIIQATATYHHDGELYWKGPEQIDTAFPQVANLDDDPEPEVLLVGGNQGVSLLNHDGSVIYDHQKPLSGDWRRPAAIHDFDGDGSSEFAMSVTSQYGVWERDLTSVWMAPVLDESGLASGTAFDFIGAGAAQAMYADETTLHIFDGQGDPLLQVARSSITHIEYPVVADVDNDGSAEIVVVSNHDPATGDHTAPMVQVIRDEEDRWIQARRIWNQHTYHVTNVREDGTIPQFEPRSWELFNTYRTQVQIEGGGACKPPPQG